MILKQLLNDTEYDRATEISRSLSASEQKLSTESLWAGTVLLWGVGDLTTTYYGLEVVGAKENNPVARRLYTEFGFEGLIVYKAAGLAMIYALTRGEHEQVERALLTLTFIFGGVATLGNTTAAFFPELR
jgi:uncharacterized membrane protein